MIASTTGARVLCGCVWRASSPARGGGVRAGSERYGAVAPRSGSASRSVVFVEGLLVGVDVVIVVFVVEVRRVVFFFAGLYGLVFDLDTYVREL